MEEITNDVVLRCLLSNCKTHTKKQAKMFSILSKKTIYGYEISKDAEKYCVKQGWMEKYTIGVPNGRENGRHYFNEVVTSQYGMKQIPILWESSKVRPWNMWKHRIRIVVPWMISLFAIINCKLLASWLIAIIKTFFEGVLAVLNYMSA